MAEPTGSLLPGEYDGANLLGLADHRILQIVQDVTAESTEFILAAASDLPLPCYGLFTDGTKEIVYLSEMNSGKDILYNVGRGVRGSTAAAHAVGSQIVIVLSGKHMNQLRDALLSAQVYQGLVGEQLPAVARVGEVFIDAINREVWFGVSKSGSMEGVWQKVTIRNHSDLDAADHTYDGHTQYHTDSRALAWHNGLGGGHVTGGDDHDHRAGKGAGRLNNGATLPSAPNDDGEVFFVNTTGSLYIGNGGTWRIAAGAPVGMIAFFDATALATYGGACPPGWVRFTDLDSAFPVGAGVGQTDNFQLVGSDTHTHNYSAVTNHIHFVSYSVSKTNTQADHTHNIATSLGGSSTGIYRQGDRAVGQMDFAAVPAHSHTLQLPAQTTGTSKRTVGGSTGVASSTTGAGSNLIPYVTGVFCQKV